MAEQEHASRSEHRWRRLFKDKVLVHVEHLLSVLLDRDEHDRNDWDEERDPPRIGQGPELEFWKISSENQEAEKISDEDESGMALERRIGAGEWNFSEAKEQGFN